MENIQAVPRRNGVVIQVGKEVTTDYDGCAGRIFIVKTITPWATCESGFMVLVHLKGDEGMTLQGLPGLGLDVNWFQPHHGPTNEERPPAPPATDDRVPDAPGRAEPAPGSDPPLPGDRGRRGGRGLGRQGNLELFNTT